MHLGEKVELLDLTEILRTHSSSNLSIKREPRPTAVPVTSSISL